MQEKAAPLAGTWAGPADAFERMAVSVLRALQRAGALRRVAKDAGLELDELLKLA